LAYTDYFSRALLESSPMTMTTVTITPMIVGMRAMRAAHDKPTPQSAVGMLTVS
jgi:hypothetical protein